MIDMKSWRVSVLRASVKANESQTAFLCSRGDQPVDVLGVVEAPTQGAALAAAVATWPARVRADNVIVEEIAPDEAADVKVHQTSTTEIDCVVYDVESARCMRDKWGREPEVPGMLYADQGDWKSIGIAAIAAVDTRDGVPRLFLQDNLDAFFALIVGRCVAGHSNDGFDDPLIRAHGAVISRSYDMLRKMRAAVGEPEHYVRGTTRAGRKVNDFARVNLNGMQKSDDGANAPILFQTGKIGQLCDYVLRDVAIEYRLIMKLPTLIDPLRMQPYALPIPK